MLTHTVKALHLFCRSKHCLVVTTILNKQTNNKKQKQTITLGFFCVTIELQTRTVFNPQTTIQKIHGRCARLSISTRHMSSIPKITRVSKIMLIFRILHVLITIVCTYTNNINYSCSSSFTLICSTIH